MNQALSKLQAIMRSSFEELRDFQLFMMGSIRGVIVVCI
jgi:hypothetical protein